MTRKEIEEKVVHLSAEIGQTPKEKIKLESYFTEDLNFDSLMKLDMSHFVENTFDICILPEDLETIKNVGNAVDIIEKKLKEKKK